MFVVTRTFRDANGVFGVGSIVDPTSVKTFRSRLQQRHIVDIDESNILEWSEYFKNRYGIDIEDSLVNFIESGVEQELPTDMVPHEVVLDTTSLAEPEPIEAFDGLADTFIAPDQQNVETPEVIDAW